MLVGESGDEQSDVEHIGIKEDNKDMRVTNKNDVTKNLIKKKHSSNSTLKDENFYYIADGLKQQFKESSDFSLLNTFDASKNEARNREISQKLLLKPSNDPVQNSEEKSSPKEKLLKEDKIVPESSELPQGLWHREPLFFTPDDPRFEGAVKFVKYINPDYAKTFANLRKQIKSVVRYKVQKSKQQANQRVGPKVDRHNKRKKFKANKKK